MRHIVIRYNIRMILLFGLVIIAMVSVPRLYKKPFLYNKDVIEQYEVYQKSVFPDLFSNVEASRDISLEFNFLNDDYVFSELKIEDLNLNGLKIRADVVLKGRFIKDESDPERIVAFSGKLFSRHIMFGPKRFMTARMSFRVTKDALEIKSLNLDRSYELKGSIGLVEPFETDLRFEIKRVNIRDFVMIAKAKNPDIALGIVSGVFNIKGPLGKLVSDGSLQSRRGKVGPVVYDIATIRFEGFGPIINIVDSNVRRSGNNTLTMEGYIDLRKIAKGNIFRDLKIKSDIQTIVWDGWDIAKNGTDEMKMTKQINDKMQVSFKAMAMDHSLTSYYDRQNPEEMSLGYKLGEESLKLKLKENEEFFGIEHNLRF